MSKNQETKPIKINYLMSHSPKGFAKIYHHSIGDMHHISDSILSAYQYPIFNSYTE